MPTVSSDALGNRTARVTMAEEGGAPAAWEPTGIADVDEARNRPFPGPPASVDSDDDVPKWHLPLRRALLKAMTVAVILGRPFLECLVYLYPNAFDKHHIVRSQQSALAFCAEHTVRGVSRFESLRHLRNAPSPRHRARHTFH